MTWGVRHEGSPRAMGGLSTAAVLSGLADGRLEPNDEVRDEPHGRWTALESHPEFAEAAAEVEPPPRVEPEDDTRLDMNPLIDVCLVLLIFFILTTTYETIRKVLDMPGATQTKVDAAVKKTQLKRVKELTIRVNVRNESGKPTIRIEDKVVSADDVAITLGQYVRASHKRQILLDAKGVEWGLVVKIMDGARAAGIEKTILLSQ